MMYMNATHASPVFNVESGKAVNHRMEPCVFLGHGSVEGKPAYWYGDSFDATDRFFTYEPLPEWGKEGDCDDLQ